MPITVFDKVRRKRRERGPGDAMRVSLETIIPAPYLAFKSRTHSDKNLSGEMAHIQSTIALGLVLII